MGIVWETYHKGVPISGVPGITLDFGCLFVDDFLFQIPFVMKASTLRDELKFTSSQG